MQKQERHPSDLGMDTRAKVLFILSQELGVAQDDLTADDTLVGTLGATSENLIEIVVAIEEDFDVVIDDDEVELHGDDWTVEEVVQLVRAKVGETGVPT